MRCNATPKRFVRIIWYVETWQFTEIIQVKKGAGIPWQVPVLGLRSGHNWAAPATRSMVLSRVSQNRISGQ